LQTCCTPRNYHPERQRPDDYARQGKKTVQIPDEVTGESFEVYVRRSGNPFDGDCDVVVYQMPYLHNSIRGCRRLRAPGSGTRHRRDVGIAVAYAATLGIG